MVSGPLWIGEMTNRELAGRMLEECREDYYVEAGKLLKKIVEEDTTIIGFYTIPSIARLAKTSPISPSEVITKLREMGYRATVTHVEPNGVKTDAPLSEIVEIFRKWSA